MLSKNPRRSQTAATAVALTIAGSDSSAGAGAQADLKTFTALGVYGVTAITCIVAETPGKVSRIQAADPKIVREQIELLLKSFPVAGIKTGLLCNAEIVAQVVRSLRKVKGCGLVGDHGGVSKGRGAPSRNRDGKKICFFRRFLAFRLEIRARKNLRPQPINVAARPDRSRVIRNSRRR